MTASWLRPMGWREVFVLVAAGEERGFPENPVLREAPRDRLVRTQQPHEGEHVRALVALQVRRLLGLDR